MKHLQLFEQFINEAADPVSTQEKVRKFLEGEGFKVEGYGAKLNIDLGKQVKEIPSNVQKAIDKVKKIAKNGDMMAIKTSVGYYMGNSVGFIFSVNRANVKKAYHVASADNVDSILMNGLEPREAASHSDQFGSSAGDSDTEQTYRAAFVVGSKKGIKIVQDLFNIKDPVVLQIDAKGLDFFEDPLMPRDAKSAVTYNTIPPERITKL